LLSSARITADWDVPPSPEAIQQLDRERFIKNPILNESPGEDDLAFARVLLAQHSAENLAAALVRLHRTQLPAAEDLFDPGSASDRSGPHTDKRGKRELQEPFRKRGIGEHESDPYRDRVKGVTPKPMKHVWFRLDIGRRKNADPKWLVPIICRKGNVTKQDIGVIRIFDNETKFEIDERVAEEFAQNVRNAPRGDGNIEPSSAPGSSAPRRYSPPQEARKEVHGKSKHKSGFVPTRERDGEGGNGDRAKPAKRAKFRVKPKSAIR
jgi:ATP-dependent RNA helicase DeaD